jgi:Lrp/AsnC family transcriptional regulator, leucine-responsive regulatory protein
MPKKIMPALDAFDLSILDLYQHDTQLSSKIIADRVGLSAAAVQRRLKHLRETGVIEREFAKISAKAVDLPITCIVSVKLRSEHMQDATKFRKKMLNAPEIQQCYSVTGESDYILIMLAKDMESYSAFTQRVLMNDNNVMSFITHVALESVKVSLAVPLKIVK